MTWTGARALTAQEDAPSGVATDGTRVLFTTGRHQAGENALRTVSLDGEAGSHIVATNPGGSIPNSGLAIDGDVVYVGSGGNIVRQPIAGGDGTVVVEGRPAFIEDIVVAGDDLWWTTGQLHAPDRTELARMPKSGGPVEVVAVDVASAINDPHPDGDTALVGTPGGILRLRAATEPEVVVGEKALGGAVTHLAMDDRRYYVLVAGPDRLLAIPRGGGPPVVLADGVDSFKGLVLVDEEVVFFSRKGLGGSGGRVALLAVPGTGGPSRTIASGTYADGDLAAVGDGRVVFSANFKVWIASVHG